MNKSKLYGIILIITLTLFFACSINNHNTETEDDFFDGGDETIFENENIYSSNPISKNVFSIGEFLSDSTALVKLSPDTVHVKSTYAKYIKENAIDSNNKTLWASALSDAKPWIYIEFAEVKPIIGIRIEWFNEYYASNFQLYGSNDEVSWNLLLDKHISLSEDFTATASNPVNFKYFAIQCVTKNKAAVGINEFTLYERKSVPEISTNDLSSTNTYFRLNDVGYLTDDTKIAILAVHNASPLTNQYLIESHAFHLVDTSTNTVVATKSIGGNRIDNNPSPALSPFRFHFECDFSDFKTPGTYKIRVGNNAESKEFFIGDSRANTAYKKALSNALYFFKTQRCGDTDPAVHLVCHSSSNTFRDATDKYGNNPVDLESGWHDAGDYIKYMITDTYTAVQLLYALEYGLDHNLDSTYLNQLAQEIKVGLDWIMKMTNRHNENIFYYQIGGSEDHDHEELPNLDPTPRVYREGFGGNILGRSIAALAMGNRLLQSYFPAKTEQWINRAKALDLKKSNFEFSQKSDPVDFYGETTWLEDMVLGESELYRATGIDQYKAYAEANVELLGDALMQWENNSFLSYLSCYKAGIKTVFTENVMKNNLGEVLSTSVNDPFFLSSTYGFWGTNAVTLGDAMKAIYFADIAGTGDYLILAESLRDFLLGRNNWGVAFVVALGTALGESDLDTPDSYHGHIRNNGLLQPGAVVGGPATYATFMESGVEITPPGNTYQIFNGNQDSVWAANDIVYFDELNDWCTNEISLDYTVGSVLLFMYNVIQSQ